MRQFPLLLKSALTALLAFSAGSAVADIQRHPEPGRIVNGSEAQFMQSQENLFGQEPPSQEGQLNPGNSLSIKKGSIRQRPENMLRTAEMPKGNINVICSRFYGQSDYGQSYYGKINPLTGRTSPIYRGSHYANGDEFELMAGIIRKDILHMPMLYYSAEDMVTGSGRIRWKRVDLTTGKSLTPVDFPLDEDGLKMFLYSGTYVEDSDKIYGLAMNVQTGGGSELVEIDCSQPEWKAKSYGVLATGTNDFMVNIVYNPLEEKLFGFASDGTFNEIDINGDKARKITVAEFDDWDNYYCYLPANYSAGICYSPYDQAYIFHLNNPMTGEYITSALDANTYEAFMLSNAQPSAYYPVFYCTDPYANENAPDRMGAPEINFKDAELTGSVTCVIPNTLFNGTKLEKNVILHILCDGEEIVTDTAEPGATLTKEITVGQGLHTLEIYCSLDKLKGAKRNTTFYAGYDTPLAPTGLALANGILTWKAPVNRGVNSAYNSFVDLSDLTYDVYINSTKLNDTPIAETSFKVDASGFENMRYNITVTATSHGLTSAPSEPLTRTIGAGYSLPVEFAPTNAQADQFEIVNSNRDSYAFEFEDNKTDGGLFSLYTNYYVNTPDDWLFLPPVYVDSNEKLYELAFDYIGVIRSAGYYDSLEICLGSDPNPAAMGEPFYYHNGREQSSWTTVKSRFFVENPGIYYIGIHAKAASDPEIPNRHRGIDIKNFKVSKTDYSLLAPGKLDNINVSAAPKGDLQFHVTGTLPTKSINGQDLAPDTEITVTADANFASGEFKGLPGAEINYFFDAPDNGVATVTLVPSSKDGSGLVETRTFYVGIDAPLAPTNVKGIIGPDNQSVSLTWDPVGEVGRHGGYVNPEEVVYDIYTQTTQDSYRVGSAGKGVLSYVYTTNNKTQAQVNVGPVAITEGGSSINGRFFTDFLGALYDVPAIEEWGYDAFTLKPWFSNTSQFSNYWNHLTDPTAFSSMGIGTPVLGESGGMYVEGSGFNSGNELIAPKVSTLHAPKVRAILRYWDSSKAGNIELWGRTYSNQEPRKIGELTPPRQNNNWLEFECDLPEDFGSQPWIQVNVRGVFENQGIVILDNYQILQNLDEDFMVSDIEAPFNAFIGETPQFNVIVTNSGKEVASGDLTVDLLGDDNVIDSQTLTVGRIRPNDTYEYLAEFPMLESYVKYNQIKVRATASCVGDCNPLNDVKEVELLLYDHSMPIVRDLKASLSADGSDVELTWSAPDAKYKDLESFELAPAFVNDEMLDRWINFDGDGMVPFALENHRWAGDDKVSAWQVFDARIQKTFDDERLSPHSGDRMVLARSIAYQDSEKPTRSFDWLISPEVEGGSKVSFWYNTLSSTYTETVQIWYSTTDQILDLENIIYKDVETGAPAPIECGSFKFLQNFTKSGADTWEFCETTLPADAKYFAFVYASYGQFGAMLDDISFSPVEKGEVEISGYDVFMAAGNEEPQLIGTVAVPGFTHKTGESATATYYVKTIHEAGTEFIYSPFSNPASVDASGIGEIPAGQFVGGAKGHILVGGAEGESFSLYDIDGRVILQTVISSDRQSIPCNAGIYTVRLGNASVKVIVR